MPAGILDRDVLKSQITDIRKAYFTCVKNGLRQDLGAVLVIDSMLRSSPSRRSDFNAITS